MTTLIRHIVEIGKPFSHVMDLRPELRIPHRLTLLLHSSLWTAGSSSGRHWSDRCSDHKEDSKIKFSKNITSILDL
jgi:hypothetical protein